MQNSPWVLAGVAVVAVAIGAGVGVTWQSRVDEKKAAWAKLNDFPNVELSCEAARHSGNVFVRVATLDEPIRISAAKIVPTKKGVLTVRCIPNPGDADPLYVGP